MAGKKGGFKTLQKSVLEEKKYPFEAIGFHDRMALICTLASSQTKYKTNLM